MTTPSGLDEPGADAMAPARGRSPGLANDLILSGAVPVQSYPHHLRPAKRGCPRIRCVNRPVKKNGYGEFEPLAIDRALTGQQGSRGELRDSAGI